MSEYYCGHKINISNGYQEIYLPTHQRARNSGNVHVHILVAEQKLGRNLKNEEVVHHIDEDRLNNDMNNLMVFATQSDHAAYHKAIQNIKSTYILFCIEGVYHCIYNPENIDVTDLYIYDMKLKTQKQICPICGKPKYKYAKVCDYCSSILQRKVKRPSRSILKIKLRTMSICSIGKEYGVSDNSIRKWCDTYNLPRKKTDIMKYSDEEWEKL